MAFDDYKPKNGVQYGLGLIYYTINVKVSLEHFFHTCIYCK
jgi:hypothetical protein